jgi:hypothetical protein
LETVVAMFLFSTCLLTVFRLLHVSLRQQSQVLRQAQAALLAEQVTDTIRGWSRQSANYYGTWAIYDGVDLNHPDFPDLTARVDCQGAGRMLDDPCSSWEAGLVPPRRLTRPVVPLRVRVNWDATHSVSMLTYLEAPPKTLHALDPLRLTGGTGSPVARDATLTFDVKLFDSADQEITDAMFTWSLQAVTGNARYASISRDGRQAVLLNSFLTPTGTVTHVPGTVRVEVLTRYYGWEVKHAESVELAGPAGP